MCGIIAIHLHDKEATVAQSIHDGLTMLQHRGQDAAGIVTTDTRNWKLNLRKDNGSVAEVFTQRNMEQLKGHVGIGHVRYPTAGGASSAESQPFFSNYPMGLCLAHNGNLTNAAELRAACAREMRHVNTNSDSELLLNVFADELTKRLELARSERRASSASSPRAESPSALELAPEDAFAAVAGVMEQCRGGYAAVVLVNGIGLVAFRDPLGIRPLVFGSRPAEPASGAAPESAAAASAKDWAVASESVGLDVQRFMLERDVAPGEAVLFPSDGGAPRTKLCVAADAESGVARAPSPCLFEYVYFARPDSVLDGVPVHEARLAMGEALADKIVAERGAATHGIDVVVPVPDTARPSALRLAKALGVPYAEALVKNRYIGRTFLMPGQAKRRKNVRLKLNALRSEMAGKAVCLVDDSIVRGTTSRELVQLARGAGATRVFFCSAAPEVRYANVYGIDIPTRDELIAHGRDATEIASEIGADWVCYQSIERLRASVASLNPALTDFDGSCFDGRYITGDVDERYLDDLAAGRPAGRQQPAGGSEAAAPPPAAIGAVEPAVISASSASSPPCGSPRCVGGTPATKPSPLHAVGNNAEGLAAGDERICRDASTDSAPPATTKGPLRPVSDAKDAAGNEEILLTGLPPPLHKVSSSGKLTAILPAVRSSCDMMSLHNDRSNKRKLSNGDLGPLDA